MANVNAPFGLRPVRYLSGAPYNGACRTYYLDANDSTAYFIGDPVTLTGDVADADGNPEIIIATVGTGVTTDRIVGAIVGFVPDPLYTTLHRAASTPRKVLVADDPNLLFEMQEDGNMGLNATSATAQIVTGSGGSTATGLSSYQIDSSEEAQTATDQLRIIGPVPRVDNDAASANAKWLVMINMHAYDRGTAGY